MKRVSLLGILILLWASFEGMAGQKSSGKKAPPKGKGDIEISAPTDFKKLTPDYVRPSEEVESIDYYKKLLELKQNPEAAYDAQVEGDLTKQEAQIETALERQHSEEERLTTNLKTIEATMPSMYSKALNYVSFGWLGGGSPAEAKYSQDDLKKVQDAVAGVKADIKEQEADLEMVSKEINELTAEKEKLGTALPTLAKPEQGVSADRIKSFQTKKGAIKEADPMQERVKALKLGDVSDTAAMGILAERFLMKLAALDKLYDILSHKISAFRAKIAEDQEILKMMDSDPELKQGAVGWGTWIYARVFVVGNTDTGLTQEQNNKLRAGLARIKKILNDEVAQYKGIIESFEQYTHDLPGKINDFKIKKSKFFKAHHDEIAKRISVANRIVVERLVESIQKKANPQIINELRNKSASYDRQRHILEEALAVSPTSQKELEEEERRSKEATADKTSQAQKTKKEGSVDDMLEALINLTEVVKGSAPDIINPVLDQKVKGFFGATLLKEVAKAGAPAAVSAMTGLLQSKLALAVNAGEIYNSRSPQIRLLTVVSQIKDIDQKLEAQSSKSGDEKEKLNQAKSQLLTEIRTLKKVLDCMSKQLDAKKRVEICEVAVTEITKHSQSSKKSEKDSELVNYKGQLEAELKTLRDQIKSKMIVSSKATNEAQRAQESQGLIIDALISVLEDSSKARVDIYIDRVQSVLPEFQSAFLEKGKKTVMSWVIPYISGLVDGQLSEILSDLSQDPTKLKYHDSHIVDLLTARITAKEGTPEYEKLAQEIRKAYQDIMAVRESYRQKLMDLGGRGKTRGLYGLGAETQTSKRQNKRADVEAKEAAKLLNQESKAYKGEIQRQSSSGQHQPGK